MSVIKNRLHIRSQHMTYQNLTVIYIFFVLRKLEILEIPKLETNLTATTMMKNYFGN